MANDENTGLLLSLGLTLNHFKRTRRVYAKANDRFTFHANYETHCTARKGIDFIFDGNFIKLKNHVTKRNIKE